MDPNSDSEEMDPVPEFVLLLNNKCQEFNPKKIVKYEKRCKGPEQDVTWTYIAFVDGTERGKGVGKTMRAAKAAAAKDALSDLGWL